jgi:ABC-type transport system involved in multi-copper enzyme maturation permease subunit
MDRTLRTELRKLTTTRSALSLLLGTVGVSIAAMWAAAAQSSAEELATALTRPNALFAIVIALPVFVAILGIRSFTDEVRHGTVVATFLATPDRRQVLAAKSIVTGAMSAAFGALAMIAGVATVVVYVVAHHAPLTVDVAMLALVSAKAIALSVAWGVIGVAIGVVVRQQVAAIVGLLVWMLIGEGVLSGAVPAVTRWLPAQSAIIGLGFDDGAVSLVAAAAAIGWIVAAQFLAAAMVRRDVV